MSSICLIDSCNIFFFSIGGLIPYVVTVVAINSIGPGEPVNYIIFTEEGSKFHLPSCNKQLFLYINNSCHTLNN